jgi:hypothetical protein
MAIITIHKSNFARSITNSMSAAKRIERNTIRFIMRVQVQEIHRTGILLNALVLFRISPMSFHRSLLLAAAGEGSGSKLPAVKRKSISLSHR